MENRHGKLAHKKKFEHKGLLFFAVASFLWFIFRTGTKPSRIVYPCQRAALANSSLLLNAFVSFSLLATSARNLLSKRSKALATLVIATFILMSSEPFWRGLQSHAAGNPNQEIQLILEPKNAIAFPASDIYVANGRAHAHISELIDLMASHGLHFCKTALNPQGLIARDDVVLIKVNCQWPQRGGTNTDVLKELIQAIVDHPEGFIGEIVVADNGQIKGTMDYGNYNNAEDHTQSAQDVVNMFSAYYNVSTYEWKNIRKIRVDEYSSGDMTDGYVKYDTADPDTGFFVSYPKFRTRFGTYISFKYGIWDGAGYEKRLKVINMPVLKAHPNYGVTASLKNYMGVQSEGKFGDGGLSNGHFTVRNGSMGTLMAETGLQTLNLIDAIYVNANPPPVDLASSPNYDAFTRVNVLMASTDPVAVDYWAAKHVLVQAASLVGYVDTHTLDPDSTDKSGLIQGDSEAFGVWLPLAKDELVWAGYSVTNSESRMNVYVRPSGDLPNDTAPPLITILSPQSRTYSVSNISLTFTVSEPTSWTGYSLDGQANATISRNTTITGLPDGSHALIVYANDTAGNIGKSNTVSFTVNTLAPYIEILSPHNKTYTTTSVDLNFTINRATSWIGYSLNWQANMTVPGNTTMSGLPDGSHTITVYANDTSGNMGQSDIVSFTIDTTAPRIEILSPQNKTYTTSQVELNFKVDEATSWIAYSLDNQANTSITGNTTLSELSEGPHALIVCSNDTAGNIGFSEEIHFTTQTLINIPQDSFHVWILVALATVAVVGPVITIYFVRLRQRK